MASCRILCHGPEHDMIFMMNRSSANSKPYPKHIRAWIYNRLDQFKIIKSPRSKISVKYPFRNGRYHDTDNCRAGYILMMKLWSTLLCLAISHAQHKQNIKNAVRSNPQTFFCTFLYVEHVIVHIRLTEEMLCNKGSMIRE